MFPERRQSKKMGGSALMIALFVIVVMAMLAAVMGRFLLDSSEKNTVEVRSVRALLAAQSGLEVALYRLFPNRTTAQPQPPAVCESSRMISFTGNPGLVDCQAVVQCRTVTTTYNDVTSTGYRLESVGSCGNDNLDGASPDFRVSRTLMVEAYDGG
ncbi:MSHA biogenesis protein MshP [Aeromonas hydrophila]|uniref:MSHA biogenesis protein MshP n=1 Tax=Aeromonas hydrophila TaxID=644 RepID=UPI00191FB026|nr:MSHA biogenesis protein MshP [Aeromonas hydrophila]MBL0434380.1 MSHA biogenesis protein MshP [Aeromonas hydrophila]MBL0470329.1 MSHA biogenesis protein MshP [Aeromonas hydrophila]